MGRARRSVAAAVAGAALLLVAGCGASSGTANAGDPAAVVTAYMQAVSGDANGGQQFLVNLPNANEVLKGSTPASRYMAAHKGTSFQIVTVPWSPPDTSAAPSPTKVACLIGKPPPSQICLVTVQAGQAFFRFALENRYSADYEIIGVDQVKSATDLLPSGNEAHHTS